MKLSNLSIRTKVLALMVTGFLLLGFGIGFGAIKDAEDALTGVNLAQLASVREGVALHIENYMQSQDDLLLAMAADKTVQDALVEFNTAFYKLSEQVPIDENVITNQLITHYQQYFLNQINFDIPGVAPQRAVKSYLPVGLNGRIAQYLFIIDNPHPVGEKDKMLFNPNHHFDYNVVHQKFHPTFRAFRTEFGLYDVFLVNLNGNLIHSDFKEKDFATNLKTGPYQDSGLGTAYQKALVLAAGEIAFDDFRPFEPSFNNPAAFIATPVFVKGQKAGVLIIQLSIDKINHIMQFGGNFEQAGLGQSGESYLVGSDFKMKSDSRFLADIDCPVVQSLNTTIGIFEIRSTSVQEALAGKTGSGIIEDYRGVKVLSAYTPVEIFGTTWAVIAEKDKEEALAEVGTIILTIAIIAVVLIIVAIVVFSVVINKMVLNPITAMLSGSEKYAGGDFRETIAVKSADELGQLATALNKMQQSFKELIQSLQHSAGELNDAARQLAGQVEQTAAGATDTAATMNEIASTVTNIAENTQEVAGKANEVSQNAEQGRQGVAKVTGQMQQIQVSTGQVGSSINDPSTTIEKIGQFAAVITNIAEQTNLLSLNAAIEAARAGEAGKGFAVVAEEVRKLAEQSAQSTGEIKQLIQDVNTQSQQSLQVMTGANEQVAQGNVVVSEVGAGLGEIIQAVQELSGQVQSVAAAAEQLTAGVENVAATTEEQTATMEEVSAATESLSKLADELNGLATKFKV